MPGFFHSAPHIFEPLPCPAPPCPAPQVKQKPAAAADLVGDIAAFVSSNYPDGESGIVYVLTRKDAESLAEVRHATLCHAACARAASVNAL